MARRIRVIEVPRDATMPAENISGPEWSTAQSQIANASVQAQMANTRVFDVRAFGNIGTSDDSQVFQDAIDAASAAGGGVLTAPVGQYTFLTGLELKDKVSIDVPLGTVFDFTGMTTYVGLASAIWGSGSIDPLPSLTATHGRNSSTLTFASAHGLSVGDTVLLYNPADESFSPHRAYYRDGEWARVAWVESSTKVELTSGLMTTEPASVNTYKLNPITTGINGAECRFKPSNTGIRIKFGADLNFTNLTLTGSYVSQLNIDKCYKVAIDNVRASDYNDPNTTEFNHYGVAINNSQDVTLSNCHLESGRHGLTTGGDSLVGCVPCRNIKVSDSFISCTGRIVSGLALHGNVERMVIDNCTAPRGITIAGNDIAVTNNDIGSNLANGRALDIGEATGANYTIQQNRIYATRKWRNQDSLVTFEWVLPAAVVDQTLVMSDNFIDARGYEAHDSESSWVVRISNRYGHLGTSASILVSNNVIRSDVAAPAGVPYSLAIRGDFRWVTVTDNQCLNGGMLFMEMKPQSAVVSNNIIHYARAHGIQWLWDTTNTYNRCTVTANNNQILDASLAGMHMTGLGAAFPMLNLSNNVIRNPGRAGATGTNSSCMTLATWRYVNLSNNVIGEDSGSLLVWADSITGVSFLTDVHTNIIGSVTARNRASINQQRVVALPAYS